MKKLWLIVLAVLLLPVPALAEADIEEIVVEELAAEELALYSLPVDSTGGFVPDPDAFTENSYEDDSISVRIESIEEDGTVFHVAWVEVESPTQLRTALAAKFGSSKTNKTTNLAKKHNAVVAMNGDYYSNREKGYIVRQGEVYRKSPFKTLDMLCIDDRGDFHILIKSDAEQLKALLESDRKIINALNFGPALVIDGEVQEMPESYQFNIHRKEPRSAIGQIGELSYVMVVADGRTSASDGATCETLANFMFGLGCQQAFNLDGGGTATLVFNGEMYNTSKGGERSISDIIYFASAVDGGFESTND